MIRAPLIGSAAAALGLIAVLAVGRGLAATAQSLQDSRAAFAQIATVLQSPSCQNCHTDAAHPFPRQGEDRHRHMFNVSRGPDGLGAPGLHCATCHGVTNNGASGVPGAKGWHLAPLSMAWEGLSVKEICQAVTDTERNGGRGAAQLIDHLTHDALVNWAWAPGVDHSGRARATPPMSHEQFLNVVNRWVETGAACPE
jgi:mono/diheme cytochrome c family protein